MKFKTIIIDDEKQARLILREELAAYSDIEIIEEASSVEEAIEKINILQPNLIFLDIHLGKSNGFDVLNAIEIEDIKVVFVTAYDQYAIRAFNYNAIHYILKPIHSIALNEVFKKLQNAVSDLKIIKQKVALIQSNRIAIQTNEGLSFHNISDIIRCQSDSNYTFIFFVNERKILTAKTLKEFEDLLTPHGFERVHNSHLINLNLIKKYINKDGGHIIMSDDEIVPLSQRKKSQFLKLFSDL